MARPIVILTDSASDISPQELQDLKVKLVPMSLAFGGKDSFLDDHSIPMAGLWERMEAGEVLTTSQPSLQTFLDLFEEAKRKDLGVVYIALSSNISGTYQTARAAVSMVDYEHIHVVDSRQAAATAAEKLLVYRACQLRDEGKLSAGEIAQDLEQFRFRVRHFSCIDTLEYLVRGGRLSKLAGNIGSLLNIKPIITFSVEGTVQVIKKVPGLKRAASELCAIIKGHPADKSFPIIPLFAKDDTNCKNFLDQLKATLDLTTDTPPMEIGATIGCHIGPGGFGLVYVEA